MGIILIRPIVKDEDIRINNFRNEILLKPQSFFIKKRLGRKITVKEEVYIVKTGLKD